ncbi:MAG: ImmA/IrrE family metallo-endopeptidase [Ruminococcus sp.]|nr:ImmA/IrrE family metallo-endopeptidase [Ruminococcus sp.]
MLDQDKLLPNERGKTHYIDDKCFIIVRDTDPPPIQRYTIAHEIGHILLVENSPEDAAERFAIGILAPACVLHALEIERAEDIAKLCNISITAASNRAERMKILNQRNAFLKHPLEREVYEQFKPFIQSKKINTN